MDAGSSALCFEKRSNGVTKRTCTRCAGGSVAAVAADCRVVVESCSISATIRKRQLSRGGIELLYLAQPLKTVFLVSTYRKGLVVHVDRQVMIRQGRCASKPRPALKVWLYFRLLGCSSITRVSTSCVNGSSLDTGE